MSRNGCDDSARPSDAQSPWRDWCARTRGHNALGRWAFAGSLDGSAGSAVSRFSRKVGRRVWRATGSLPGVPAIWHSGVGDLVVSTDHPLPHTLATHPLYSQNLPRLVSLVATKYPQPGLIDVGANIGDTALFVRAVTDTPVLCIEGNRDYIPFLRRNVAGVPDVQLEECFLGDDDRQHLWSVVSHNGTGRLSARSSASSARHTPTRTLDDVLAVRSRLLHAKVLKSDTDGFEAKVVRGAHRYLSQARPMVFLEYDPQLLAEHGDDGLEMLVELRNMGYCAALVYDAYGILLLGLPLDEWMIVEQLHDYLRQPTPIPYFDVALFHMNDRDLFSVCLERERAFYAAHRSPVRSAFA